MIRLISKISSLRFESIKDVGKEVEIYERKRK